MAPSARRHSALCLADSPSSTAWDAGTISVITNDGRQIVVGAAADAMGGRPSAPRPAPRSPLPWPALAQGMLRGYDQATNLILDECHERVYSTKVRPRPAPARLGGPPPLPADAGSGALCAAPQALQCAGSFALTPALLHVYRAVLSSWCWGCTSSVETTCECTLPARLPAPRASPLRTAGPASPPIAPAHPAPAVLDLRAALPFVRQSCRPPPPTPDLRSAVIGEIDEELDAQLDLDAVRAPPLKPVTH